MAKDKITKKVFKRQDLYNILNTNENLIRLNTCKKLMIKDKDIFTHIIMARTLDVEKGVLLVCNTEYRSNDEIKNKAIVMKFIVDDEAKSVKMSYGNFLNEEFECFENKKRIPVFGVCQEEDFAIMGLVLRELHRRKIFEGLVEVS